MQDEELLRYSRHILLDQIGIEGQKRLGNAHALIVGVGGLGAPVAMYLAAAGVSQITLVDPDKVDLTNLQRQIIHTTSNVGMAKVASAADSLHRLNPHIQINTHLCKADSVWLDTHLASVDVVLDCSDNFLTRHAINRACVRHGLPLVSGAAIRFDAQVGVFDITNNHGPCYACAFPLDDAPIGDFCATMGVFSPLVGVIGAIQAAEALKLLLDIGESLCGRIMMLEGLRMEWTEIHVPRNPICNVCSSQATEELPH